MLDKLLKLRYLDLDDLIIGTMLLDGFKRKDIYKNLFISAAAVTTRLNKMESIFGPIFDNKLKTGCNLNSRGILIFTLFKQALLILEDFTDI